MKFFEAISAALILGMPFYGSWIYYAMTGEYMDFGGAK